MRTVAQSWGGKALLKRCARGVAACWEEMCSAALRRGAPLLYPRIIRVRIAPNAGRMCEQENTQAIHVHLLETGNILPPERPNLEWMLSSARHQDSVAFHSRTLVDGVPGCLSKLLRQSPSNDYEVCLLTSATFEVDRTEQMWLSQSSSNCLGPELYFKQGVAVVPLTLDGATFLVRWRGPTGGSKKDWTPTQTLTVPCGCSWSTGRPCSIQQRVKHLRPTPEWTSHDVIWLATGPPRVMAKTAPWYAHDMPGPSVADSWLRSVVPSWPWENVTRKATRRLCYSTVSPGSCAVWLRGEADSYRIGWGNRVGRDWKFVDCNLMPALVIEYADWEDVSSWDAVEADEMIAALPSGALIVVASMKLKPWPLNVWQRSKKVSKTFKKGLTVFPTAPFRSTTVVCILKQVQRAVNGQQWRGKTVTLAQLSPAAVALALHAPPPSQAGAVKDIRDCGLVFDQILRRSRYAARPAPARKARRLTAGRPTMLTLTPTEVDDMLRHWLHWASVSPKQMTEATVILSKGGAAGSSNVLVFSSAVATWYCQNTPGFKKGSAGEVLTCWDPPHNFAYEWQHVSLLSLRIVDFYGRRAAFDVVALPDSESYVGAPPAQHPWEFNDFPGTQAGSIMRAPRLHDPSFKFANSDWTTDCSRLSSLATQCFGIQVDRDALPPWLQSYLPRQRRSLNAVPCVLHTVNEDPRYGWLGVQMTHEYSTANAFCGSLFPVRVCSDVLTLGGWTLRNQTRVTMCEHKMTFSAGWLNPPVIPGSFKVETAPGRYVTGLRAHVPGPTGGFVTIQTAQVIELQVSSLGAGSCVSLQAAAGAHRRSHPTALAAPLTAMKETIQAPFVFQLTRGAFVEAHVESSSSRLSAHVGDQARCTQNLVHTRTMPKTIELGILNAVTEGLSQSKWEYQRLGAGGDDWAGHCDPFVELDGALDSGDVASAKLALWMTKLAALVVPPQQPRAEINRMFLYELNSGVNLMQLDMSDKGSVPIPSWTVVAHIGCSSGRAMQLEFVDAQDKCSHKVELRPPMCYAMPGWYIKHKTILAPAETVVLAKQTKWYSVVCFFNTPNHEQTQQLVEHLMTGQPVFLPPDTKRKKAASTRTKRKRTRNVKRSRKTRPATEQGVALPGSGSDEPQFIATEPGPVFTITQKDVLAQLQSACSRRKVSGDGACLFYALLAGIGLLEHESMATEPTSRDKRLAMALREQIAVRYRKLNSDVGFSSDLPDISLADTYGNTTCVMLLARDLKVKVCVLDETRLHNGTVLVCEHGKQHNVSAQTYLQQLTGKSDPEAVKPSMVIISAKGFEGVGGHFALLQKAENWEMPEWLEPHMLPANTSNTARKRERKRVGWGKGVPANTPAAITGTCTVTTSQQAPPDKRRTGAGNASGGTPQEPAPPKNSNTEPTVPPPANPKRTPTTRMCIPHADWASWKRSDMARERNAQATTTNRSRSVFLTLILTTTPNPNPNPNTKSGDDHHNPTSNTREVAGIGSAGNLPDAKCFAGPSSGSKQVSTLTLTVTLKGYPEATNKKVSLRISNRNPNFYPPTQSPATTTTTQQATPVKSLVSALQETSQTPTASQAPAAATNRSRNDDANAHPKPNPNPNLNSQHKGQSRVKVTKTVEC